MFGVFGVGYCGAGFDSPLPRPAVLTGRSAMNGLIGKQLDEQKPDFQTRNDRVALIQAVVIFFLFLCVAGAIAAIIQYAFRGGF